MKTFIAITSIISLLACVSIATSYLHGDPCSSNDECIGSYNLECVNERCACEAGYTPNRQRICWKTFGTQCDWILDCNIDAFLACNDTTSTCDCQQPDRQVWDANRDVCVSLAGFTCTHSVDDPYGLHCVEGAYCDMPIIEGQMYHECTCMEGFEQTDDRKCRRLARPTRPTDW